MKIRKRCRTCVLLLPSARLLQLDRTAAVIVKIRCFSWFPGRNDFYSVPAGLSTICSTQRQSQTLFGLTERKLLVCGQCKPGVPGGAALGPGPICRRVLWRSAILVKYQILIRGIFVVRGHYMSTTDAETTAETPFEEFLERHDETWWADAISQLLPGIHEVDKAATQIWFAFY